MTPKPVNRLRLKPEQACVFRGHHFRITDRHGTVGSGRERYFLQQTRFLSQFELAAEGERLRAVSCDVAEPHGAVACYLIRSPAGRRGSIAGFPLPCIAAPTGRRIAKSPKAAMDFVSFGQIQ